MTGGVFNYGIGSSDLAQLLKRARSDPYDPTLHGAIADALDEAHPGNQISGLIRRQYGMGEHGGQGELDNLWHDPMYAGYDNTHPYMAHLGRHGPFNLYLGHEGTPPHTDDENDDVGDTQRWILRAASRLPGSNDVAYNFEFPHEEAHHIPALFPAAEDHISPHTGPRRGAEPAFPGAQTMMPREWSNEEWRERESRAFDEAMDEQERNRGEYSAYSRTDYADDAADLLKQLQHPDYAHHMAGLDDPLGGLRGIAADALDEQGRSEEANLLRTPGTHVEVRPDGTVKPSFMERQAFSRIYGGTPDQEQFVKPSYSWSDEPGNEHHSFTYWFAEPHQDGTGYWIAADGEGFDPEEVDEEHPRYAEYPKTEDYIERWQENHPMSPSELAWMRHHATTEKFRNPS